MLQENTDFGSGFATAHLLCFTFEFTKLTPCGHSKPPVLLPGLSLGYPSFMNSHGKFPFYNVDKLPLYDLGLNMKNSNPMCSMYTLIVLIFAGWLRWWERVSVWRCVPSISAHLPPPTSHSTHAAWLPAFLLFTFSPDSWHRSCRRLRIINVCFLFDCNIYRQFQKKKLIRNSVCVDPLPTLSRIKNLCLKKRFSEIFDWPKTLKYS